MVEWIDVPSEGLYWVLPGLKLPQKAPGRDWHP